MQISRRDALLGATAAAAVTGLTVIPVAHKAAGVRAALAGDPVIDLSAQLNAAREAWDSVGDAFEEASHRVGLSICDGNGLVEVESSDGPCTWSAEEIKAAAEDGRRYHRLTAEQRDAALAKLEWLKTDAQKARQERGTESLWQEVEHWKARFWDLRARLLDTPATTTRGVIAKMRGFYHDEEVAQMMAGDDPDDALEPEFAASIYRDLERLAGGMPS